MAYTEPNKTWASQQLDSNDMNTYIRDNLAYLKANIGLGTPVELTIAAGVVTKTKGYHTIDTESDGATDDLDTISGGSDGDIIFISAEHDDRTVIIKNETGNIHCGGDIYLDTAHKVVSLMYNATLTEWHSIGAYSVERTMVRNTFEYPDTTNWEPAVTGATLAQNKTAQKCWLPVAIFKIGDILIGYKLVGDAVEGTALTLDCKLVRINLADPITTTDLDGGSITQVDSDGNFDVAATLTTPETIATDKQYTLEILATTSGSDSIIVMGAEIVVIRLL